MGSQIMPVQTTKRAPPITTPALSHASGRRRGGQPSAGARSGHDFSAVRVESAAVTGIQYKLTINRPDDRYEEEADRVATRVTGMAAPGMAKGLYGRDCRSAPSEDLTGDKPPEEDTVMAKPSAGGLATGGSTPVAPTLAGSLTETRGGGNPLPGAARSFMEPRFGHDFGAVRVHTDDRAATLAQVLHAEAFTIGRDIYFGAGRFAPATSSGQWLLAHELTHVVQQNGAPAERIQRYGLRGFPRAEEAAMNAAVPAAVTKVASCSKLSRITRGAIINALITKRYDFVPDLGLCGWTFPLSWYIEIGKSAFDPSVCCDLASTLAHEASHTVGKTESGAREMECDCFGCSC